MKKTLLVIVSLCVLAVPAVFAQAHVANMGAFNMVLADDFQHGNNYMYRYYPDELLNGHRITRGENYTLQITFTVSRDLEQALEVGLLDYGPPTHWRQLSWNDNRGVFLHKIENVRAGQVYTVTIPFTALDTAGGSRAAHNAIIFLTQGEGRRARNGGVMGPVTISFTQFVFTRL